MCYVFGTALDALPLAESVAGGVERETEVVAEISFGFECKQGKSIGR